MTHSGATRRQRFGSLLRPGAAARRGREASANRAGSREDVPGNATFLRYHAAPTARPTVTTADPFILAQPPPEPCGGCQGAVRI